MHAAQLERCCCLAGLLQVPSLQLPPAALGLLNLLPKLRFDAGAPPADIADKTLADSQAPQESSVHLHSLCSPHVIIELRTIERSQIESQLMHTRIRVHVQVHVPFATATHYLSDLTQKA